MSRLVVSRLARTFLLLTALAFLAAPAGAAPIKLARHPDYHGGQIVFSYLGDIWTAREDGSNPRRLTVHPGRDVHPRFSPDGKWIAFSSNRYGNYDVFVMPASGGKAKRLTYHSANDTVVGWSRDSRHVLFSSARGLPYPGIPALYEVPASGGVERPLPTDWGYWASYSPDGKKLAFNRHPMSWSRKHYRGSYAADLWVMDVGEKTFKKLLDSDLPDAQKPNNFWPMFGDGFVYFVSDRDVLARAGDRKLLRSTNNIWKVPAGGGKPTQVTHHKSGSLFYPSLSADGKVIVYEEDFGIWKLDVESGKTSEVKIDIACDDSDNSEDTLTVSGEADGYHLSPSGKRAVISTQGEVFTIATDRGEVRRLTNTPGVRETQPRWSPDGKWIAFVSDKTGRQEVWLCDERGGKMKRLTDSDSEKGQLAWSPDSKSLLYSASDNKLHKVDLEKTGDSVVASGSVVTFGNTAISGAQWSPDGKWVAYTRAGRDLLPHVYVVPAGGGKERRVTDSDSYSDTSALWTPDGKHLVYLSGSDVGNIGQGGRSVAQLYVVPLVPQEKDPADQDIDSEEEARKAEKERPRGRRFPFGGDGDGLFPGAGRTPGKVEVKIDFNRIGRRARRLTRSADAVGSVAVSPDGRAVVFTTTGVEGGRPVRSIWSVQLDGTRLTRLTQSGAGGDGEEGPPPRRFFGGFGSLQFSKDGRTLFYQQGRNIYALTVGLGGGAGAGGRDSSSTSPTTPGGPGRLGGRGMAAGGSSGRRVNFTARVEVDSRARRKQVFEESWRVMKHRFYDPAMHGVDWERMKGVYEPLLEHVGSQEELHDLVNMMIGELNASHTGISAGGGRGRRGARESGASTRFPGFELEPDKSGYYRVSVIYRRGPVDKDYVKLKVGDYVLAVDGQELKVPDNYWRYFTTPAGTKLEFLVNSKPDPKDARTIKVTPVSSFEQANLQYARWVDQRRQAVDRLSGGDIGYLHIRQMNQSSLEQFERDLARMYTKKALVIDQRFNPGGNIDQELLQILQQKQYQYTRQRGSVNVRRPFRGFVGPMVVMANERSTSDAEVFPEGFRTLKLGRVVGVTTYGAVIGTGAYQLMDGSTIRTPSSGLWSITGQNLENYGVPPDVYVDNTPGDYLKGRDAQLEKAVEVLRAELKKSAGSAAAAKAAKRTREPAPGYADVYAEFLRKRSARPGK